jgi:hypothetical protein
MKKLPELLPKPLLQPLQNKQESLLRLKLRPMLPLLKKLQLLLSSKEFLKTKLQLLTWLSEQHSSKRLLTSNSKILHKALLKLSVLRLMHSLLQEIQNGPLLRHKEPNSKTR